MCMSFSTPQPVYGFFLGILWGFFGGGGGRFLCSHGKMITHAAVWPTFSPQENPDISRPTHVLSWALSSY